MSDFGDARELKVTVMAIPEESGFEIRVLVEGEIEAGKCDCLTRGGIDWEVIRGVVYAKLIPAIEKEIPPFRNGPPSITTFRKAEEESSNDNDK